MLYNISLYLPNRFIATNIADFHAKWFFIAADTAVPKLFGFIAVNDNKSVFINLDLAVGMPLAFGCSAVNAQKLNKLQTDRY